MLVAERPRVIGPDFLRRLLRHGTDIQAVWSVGHSADSDACDGGVSELLVFADRGTLAQLRKRDDLHEPDVTLRVVIDGDLFEAACGGHGLSGSLARWAWREVAPGEAYYDESHWAAEAGSVVRVRRKAFRLWSRAAQL